MTTVTSITKGAFILKKLLKKFNEDFWDNVKFMILHNLKPMFIIAKAFAERIICMLWLVTWKKVMII